MTSQQIFLGNMLRAGRAVATLFNLPPFYPVIEAVQAVLESGWGKHAIHFNQWGMRYAHQAGAFPVDVKTQEVVGGALVDQEHQYFAGFETQEAAMMAHMHLITGPLYQHVWEAADLPSAVTALMNSGYSTDRPWLWTYAWNHGPIEAGPPQCRVAGCPHYAGRLMALVKQYRLDESAVVNALAAGQDPDVPVHAYPDITT